MTSVEAAVAAEKAAVVVESAGSAVGEPAEADDSEMLFQVRIDEGDGEREVVVTREQLASLMASSSQGEDEDEEAGVADDVESDDDHDHLGATEDA